MKLVRSRSFYGVVLENNVSSNAVPSVGAHDCRMTSVLRSLVPEQQRGRQGGDVDRSSTESKKEEDSEKAQGCS